MKKIFLKNINKKKGPARNASRSDAGGYTIIETMIAISVFLVVVMSGMGALLNANLLSEKSKGLRAIMDNLSFIMEDMSKNLRTGYGYHCLVAGQDSLPTATLSAPKSCASGWGIAFEPANGVLSNNNDQWVYYVYAGKIFKSTQGPSLLSNFTQLSPDEVVIDLVASSFSVLGAEAPSANQQQPLVNIRLVGTINYKNIVTPFSLQTSVSQRLLDV